MNFHNKSIAEIFNVNDKDLQNAFISENGSHHGEVKVYIEPFNMPLEDGDYTRISDKVYSMKDTILAKYPKCTVVGVDWFKKGGNVSKGNIILYDIYKTFAGTGRTKVEITTSEGSFSSIMNHNTTIDEAFDEDFMYIPEDDELFNEEVEKANENWTEARVNLAEEVLKDNDISFNMVIYDKYEEYKKGGSIKREYKWVESGNDWKRTGKEYTEKEFKEIYDKYKNDTNYTFILDAESGKSIKNKKTGKITYYSKKYAFAKGGNVPKEYKLGSAEELWGAWDEEQRHHFLEDHEGTETMHLWRKMIEWNYNDLPEKIKMNIKHHFHGGRYALGGNVEMPFKIY